MKTAYEAFNSVNDTKHIAVAGDWHGSKGWACYMIRLAAEHDMHVLFQMGDFGFWPGNNGRKYLYKINKQLVEVDSFIFVTAGNHEDYRQMSRFLPVPDMPGCTYNPEYPRIILMSRGFRWTWAGRKFISVGGANSIDKDYRIEGQTWWKGEQITIQDIQHSIDGGKVDVMFSHDLPMNIEITGHHRTADKWNAEEIEYANHSREALQKVIDVIQPEFMLHGHYHIPYKTTTELKGKDGVDYSITSVCLSMDYTGYNLGVLNVENNYLEMLDIPKPDWNFKYSWDEAWWLNDKSSKPWWA